MKAAFYYLAFGDPAASCCALAAKSLRQAGWDGELLIVTDRTRSLYGENKVRQIEVPDGVINLNPSYKGSPCEIDVRFLHNSNIEKFAICYLKPMLYRWVDLSDYGLVLFSDVDVLANKPVDETISRAFRAKPPFVVAKNRRPLPKTKSCNANLSGWEKLKWGRKTSISSGFFSIVPCKATLALLKEWETECLKGIHGDQAALQAVILRKFQRVTAYFPYYILGYGPGWKEFQRNETIAFVDSAFVHFQGAIRHPNAMELYYSRFLR